MCGLKITPTHSDIQNIFKFLLKLFLMIITILI